MRPSSTSAIRSSKDFVIINKELYCRGNSDILAWAIFVGRANEELQRVHELSYRINDISLYKRLQSQGYYWPEVAKEVVELQ